MNLKKNEYNLTRMIVKNMDHHYKYNKKSSGFRNFFIFNENEQRQDVDGKHAS